MILSPFSYLVSDIWLFLDLMSNSKRLPDRGGEDIVFVSGLLCSVLMMADFVPLL